MLTLRPGAVEAWRKQKKLTQAELAKRAGISRATVIRIEQEGADTASLTFDTVNKLAAALEQDADALVTFR
jgi:transcriptional regulator with XRE-family HTH domain